MESVRLLIRLQTAETSGSPTHDAKIHDLPHDCDLRRQKPRPNVSAIKDRGSAYKSQFDSRLNDLAVERAWGRHVSGSGPAGGEADGRGGGGSFQSAW